METETKEKDVERIISQEEMKQLEKAGFARLLNFGGENEYIAGYMGHTYVLREKRFYEMLR